MSEAHRYKAVKMLSEAGNRITYSPHGPNVVMAEAYDQLKAENEELKKNVHYSDQIIETRNRLLKLIPPCPVHGEECVPHAMEWVSAALAKESGQ